MELYKKLKDTLEKKESACTAFDMTSCTKTIFEKECVKTGIKATPDGDVFYDNWKLYNEIVIFGAGTIAQILSGMAKELNFRVTVIDDNPDFACKQRFKNVDNIIVTDYSDINQLRFPRMSYFIVLTREHKHDYECVKQILRIPHSYIGMLGNKKIKQEMVKKLTKAGYAKKAANEVDTPIGIDIKAKNPTEVAFSIIAGIIAVKHKVSMDYDMCAYLSKNTGILITLVRGTARIKPGRKILIKGNEVAGSILRTLDKQIVSDARKVKTTQLKEYKANKKESILVLFENTGNRKR